MEASCSASYGAVREEDVVFADALSHVGDGARRAPRRRAFLGAVVSAAVLFALAGAALATRGGAARDAAPGAVSLAQAGKKHSGGGGKHSKHSKASKSSDSEDAASSDAPAADSSAAPSDAFPNGRRGCPAVGGAP